ncbi:hypothetical protein [Agarivorans sp. B2Z047]|uniref:hypothetical protein n=1 Tax=Agarivorans sp. B2Z047 TaxID=2652721 RepID=UPI00128E58EB|nr:hypothetical protein [Agarivorans sp. B2Z047]UQN41107.1 hypothetical protein LQZ07_15175 [Agarivorans sp. B2Z047]
MIRILLATLMFCGLSSGPLFAQELSRNTAERVQRVFQLQQDGELAKAISQLEQLKPSAKYDQAYIARMLGIYYWQDEQVALSKAKLVEAVNLQAFPPQQAWETRNMLAEILLSEQHIDEALSHFEILLTQVQQPELELDISPSQTLNLRANLAYANYQQQNWQAVLDHLAALEQLQVLDKNNLSMRFIAQVQLKQLKAAIITNQALLVLEPETLRWWQQLSALYSQTQQHQKALATLVSAERSGLALGESLLRHKAQLYAYLRVPEKAALSYAQLADADSDAALLLRQAQLWQQAREWQKSANYWQLLAEHKPEYNLQYAQVLLLSNQYTQAIEALKLADPQEQQAKSQLLLAEIYLETKDYSQAYAAAQRAHNLEQSSQSERWLNYLEALVADTKA